MASIASESLSPNLSRHLAPNRRLVSRFPIVLCLAASIFLGICYTVATFLGTFYAGSSLESPIFWNEQKTISQGCSHIANSTTRCGHTHGDGFVSLNENLAKSLGVASRIFVVSLPRRVDRREQMEVLRTASGAQWTYVEGIESRSLSIQKIMDRARTLREDLVIIDSVDATVPARMVPTFRWPQNIDALSSSIQPLTLAGSELWISSLLQQDAKGSIGNIITTGGSAVKIAVKIITAALPKPMTCATDDNSIPKFTQGLPEYKILTRAKIACWNSHQSAIRRIVDGSNKYGATAEEDVSVILEDDIDMEWDIQARLSSVWTSLPGGWDMVFLGT